MKEVATQRGGFVSIHDGQYCECGEELLPEANFCIWCGRPIHEAYLRLKTELNEAIAAITDAPPKPDLANLSSFAEDDTKDMSGGPQDILWPQEPWWA